MMISNRTAFTCTLVLLVSPIVANAADVDLGLITDIGQSATSVVFASPELIGDRFDQFNGNSVVSFAWFGGQPGGVAVVDIGPVSNGENGDGNATNPSPSDSVFSTIGNTSGRLEQGNVIRFSVWMRQNPDFPVLTDPVFAHIGLHFRDAPAATGNSTIISDTAIDAPGLPPLIDLNGDGVIAGGVPPAVSVTTDEWRLAEVTYVVDDSTWQNGFLSDVEEIRGIVFFGYEFNQSAGGDPEIYFVDNALIEVFADESLVTPNQNPNPAFQVPEPSGLTGLALGLCVIVAFRRRKRLGLPA